MESLNEQLIHDQNNVKQLYELQKDFYEESINKNLYKIESEMNLYKIKLFDNLENAYEKAKIIDKINELKKSYEIEKECIDTKKQKLVSIIGHTRSFDSSMLNIMINTEMAEISKRIEFNKKKLINLQVCEYDKLVTLFYHELNE